MAESSVLRAVVEHLAAELAEMEVGYVQYRELLQVSLAQNAVLAAENQRLRRSREAEAAITGSYPR